MAIYFVSGVVFAVLTHSFHHYLNVGMAIYSVSVAVFAVFAVLTYCNCHYLIVITIQPTIPHVSSQLRF